MILHFTNPFDNDTLSLPCNLPFGVYLALEVGIIMATSFPVKANTWYDWVKICHVRATQSTKKKLLKWYAEECKNKRSRRQEKNNVFFSSVINCLEYEVFQSQWITVSDYQAAAMSIYKRAETSVQTKYRKNLSVKQNTGLGPLIYRI